MKKRILSVLLSVALLFTTVIVNMIPSAMAMEESQKPFTISADSGNSTISIVKTDDPGIITSPGTLAVSAGTQSIQRDYAQSATIQVTNNTGSPIEYYLVSDNSYDDISLNFVKNGSEEEPLVILNGETQAIELSVFAQNATRTRYNIPIMAYIVTADGTEDDAVSTLTLNVPSSVVDVSFSLLNTEVSTLMQTYRITNNGPAISDLTLTLSGDAADCARINPGVENYELGAGKSVTVNLIPDLLKFKAESLTLVSGELVAQSGGKTASTDVSFDTQGQEITVTTMGQLGLLQDGNEYNNLEIDPASIVMDAEFNENDFDISGSYTFTYGDNEVLPVQVEMNGVIIENDDGTFEETIETIDNGDGTVTLHFVSMIEIDEYDALVSQFSNTSSFSTQQIAPYVNTDAAKTVVDIGITIADEVVKDGSKAAKFLKAANVVSVAIDGWNLFTSGDRVACVLASTNLNSATKASYGLLKTGETLLFFAGVASLFVPGAGWAFAGTMIAGSIAGYYGGEAQKKIEGEGNCGNSEGAIYYDRYGNQCTNRGRVDANFYLPNYGIPSAAHTTGRMYGGGYVNNWNTNYDNFINGHNIGSSHNSGLTEVVMTEIPVDKINIGGNNTFTRDYDTNPGSHSVIADTEFVIQYPWDTEIAYIGDPSDLEEVRSLADLAVYPENIYPSNDAIVGEPSQIRVNVFNRGSRGAWAEITVDVNGSTVYTDSVESEGIYRYISAFSSASITFDWTPEQANNDIVVTLTNVAIDMPDRKADNNLASKTVMARIREVPTIDIIAPTSVYIDGSSANTWFTADISNVSDIKSVSFTVDDTEPLSASMARLGSGIRASVGVPNPAIGDHTVKAIVEYYTSSTATATVEDTETISVQQVGKINFSIDTDTVENPQFRVYGNNSYYSGLVSNVSIGEYSLQKTVLMESGLSNYYLLVKCDAGVILMPLKELDGATLTLDETTAHKLSFTTGDASITGVTVSSLNNYAFSTSYTFSDTSELLFSNNITEARIRANYSVASISASMPSTVSVNLSDDLDIDLTQYYRLFQFILPEKFEYYGYIPLDIIATISPNNTYYLYGNTNYNQSSRTYSYLLTDSYYLTQLANADTITAWLPLEDTLFNANLTTYNDPVKLDAEGYTKITFALDEQGILEVGTTTVYANTANMYNGYGLYGEELFVPSGSYNLQVNYTANGISASYFEEDVTIASDTEITLPNISEADRATISFDWPQRFENASFSYRLTSYYWGSGVATARNQRMTIPAGETDVALDMYTYVDSPYDYTSLRIDRTVAGVAGENVDVAVGDSFTGSLRRNSSNQVDGGSQVYIYLDNMVDEYGNRLSNYDAYSNMNALAGTVTFTNKVEPEDTISIRLNSLISYVYSGMGLYVTIPNVTGEYYYTLNMTSDKAESDAEKVAADKAVLTWDAIKGTNTSQKSVTSNLTLPTSGVNGSTITWTSSEPATIFTNGLVTRPSYSNGNKNVTLTATITSGDVSEIVTFALTVLAHSYTPPYNPPTTDIPETTPPLAGDWSNPYGDVSDINWFFEAVRFVTESGLMKGTGNGKFSPNVTMTRAMMVTVLYRLEEEPDVSGNNLFSDVTSGQWYSDAILWAGQNGIVNGYNIGTFGWNDDVTREQAVLILYRYAKIKGLDVSARANLSGYIDMDDISDWALDAMKWAVAVGIIQGRTATTTVPKGSSTRAEVAMIFKRYLEDFIAEGTTEE